MQDVGGVSALRFASCAVDIDKFFYADFGEMSWEVGVGEGADEEFVGFVLDNLAGC